MSGHTVHDHIPNGATLAGTNEGTCGAAGFANDGALALGSHLLEPFAGGKRTDFFVGVVAHSDGQTIKVFLAGVLESVEDRDDTGLAVGATRPRHLAVFNLEGACGGGTVGKHGVEVSIEHDVELFGTGLVRRKQTLAGLRAEVHKFRRKTDGVEVALHDVGHLGDAFAVGAAAVEIDNFGEVLEVGLEHLVCP